SQSGLSIRTPSRCGLRLERQTGGRRGPAFLAVGPFLRVGWGGIRYCPRRASLHSRGVRYLGARPGQNPRLAPAMPKAQQIGRPLPIVLLGRRTRLVALNLRDDPGGNLNPFGESAEGSSQPV